MRPHGFTEARERLKADRYNPDTLTVPLTTARRFGPYEILAPLGARHGRDYRVRDTDRLVPSQRDAELLASTDVFCGETDARTRICGA